MNSTRCNKGSDIRELWVPWIYKRWALKPAWSYQAGFLEKVGLNCLKLWFANFRAPKNPLETLPKICISRLFLPELLNQFWE